jgi:hypothetical protein
MGCTLTGLACKAPLSLTRCACARRHFAQAVNKIGGGPFSAADQELLQGFAYEVAAILKRKLHDAAYDRVSCITLLLL